MSDRLVPGAVVTGEDPVVINEGRETAEVTVGNAGDRPVQVGSHAHFAEVNAALSFDRVVAVGMRLNIPAGTAVRFEPGEQMTVELVAFGGKRRFHGMNGLTNGSVEDTDRVRARAREQGFAGVEPATGDSASADEVDES